MPTFMYRGVTTGGGQVRAEITAPDERAAARQLRSQGIVVQNLAVKRAGAAGGRFDPAQLPGLKLLFGGVRGKDIAVFSRQFATMIAAGLPLVQCLQTLAMQMERKRFRDIIGRVAADVEGGSTLSEGMAKFPEVFDELYVNLVHVGETGGVLDSMLSRLSTYLEKAQALRHRVQMAIVYPALVISIAVLVVAFLMIYIIPIFAGFFANAGVPLPLPTRIVIAASNILARFWYLILLAIGGIMYGIRFWYRTDSGRLTIDRLMLRAPVIGPLVRKISIARFTRTLSALLGGGVPIIDALRITARTSGNRVIENAVMAARERVTAGHTLGERLKDGGVFPPMVVQMVIVGEQTGALDNMLGKVADYYEDEVDVAVAGLTALLEPVLIVFLGIVIGGIVISIYLPIFKVVTLIK
jgi:type IV pilus assembly protein PilC